MKNEEIYKSLNEKEGLKLYSYMGIVSRDKEFKLEQAKIKSLLDKNDEFEVKSFDVLARKVESEGINTPVITASIEYEDEVFEITLVEYSMKGLDLRSFSFANTVDDESMKLATAVPSYLEVEMMFVDDPMISFLFQLKVLHTIMPNASLVVDFSSLRLLSPYWLEMTAGSTIPPSPNYLYIIHAVYDEKENGEKQYWMHTHGLHRCGSMELELVHIMSGANEMHNMINTAANLFLLDHFKENEIFQVGYDGLGLNLCWLRWEEALKEFPENVLGGMADRESEGENFNIHAEPSGILFAVEDGNYTSPEIYTKTLADNPIFYVKNEETFRMSMLAKERFLMFKNTFNEFGLKDEKKSLLGKIFGGKKEEPQWTFLVKIGLMTDEAEDASEKEHLWFEVQSIEGNDVKGKLLNQPYWIAGLNEGDVKIYPVDDFLTDWLIYGPEGEYTPDTIYLLA